MSAPRWCCDGHCKDNQGRGTCPAEDEQSEESRITQGENRRIMAGIIAACTLWAAVAGWAVSAIWSAL